MHPTLSFIIPNYNHAKFLPTSLQAVLSQSRKADEVIVIDDASTDNSAEVVLELAKTHPELRLHRFKQNQGPMAAVNQGIALAKGDYIGFGSADDYILPGFFEEALLALQRYPKAGLASAKISFFKDNSSEIWAEKEWIDLGKTVYFSSEKTEELFLKTNFRISSPTTIFKKSSLLRVGGYREHMKMLSDWFLNCEIALQEGFIFIPKTFACVRDESQNYSGNFYQDKKKKEAVFDHILQYIENDPHPQLKKSLILYQLGIEMVFHLLKRPRYWSYLPRIALKKLTKSSVPCKIDPSLWN